MLPGNGEAQSRLRHASTAHLHSVARYGSASWHRTHRPFSDRYSLYPHFLSATHMYHRKSCCGPTFIESIFLIILIGETRNSYRVKQAGVYRVCCTVIIFGIIRTDQRKSLRTGLECIHQVLARLVEVTATYSLRSGQLVAKVQITIFSSVILRILNRPDGLSAFRIAAESSWSESCSAETARFHYRVVRISQYGFQVIFVNFRHFILFILTVGFVKHCFCQIGGSCRTGGTSLYGLPSCIQVSGRFWKANLKSSAIFCHCSSLVYCTLEIFVYCSVRNRFVHNHNILEHLFKHKHIVAAQETHFSDTCLFQRIIGFINRVE